MKQVEMWRWWTSDPERPNRKPTKTRHHMSEAGALATDPNATRVAGSMELRTVCEPGDVMPANSAPGPARFSR